MGRLEIRKSYKAARSGSLAFLRKGKRGKAAENRREQNENNSKGRLRFLGRHGENEEALRKQYAL